MELARIASSQHGLVTWRQCLASGLSPTQIKDRAAKGLLIAIYPSIYRVGHWAPSIESSFLAAVLAGGKGSLLSGRAAAHLLGIWRGSTPDPEITCPGDHKIPGLRTRRARRTVREGTVWRGVPVTTPAETAVDLAEILDIRVLAGICHVAGIKHHLAASQVDEVLKRRPNAPGIRKIRAIYRGDVQLTLSELERRFVALLTASELPLPLVNRIAGGRYVDCRWPAHHLTVELDSYRYHHSRHAWEDDQDRERLARKRGDDFRKFTWGTLEKDPAYVLRELRTLLT